MSKRVAVGFAALPLLVWLLVWLLVCLLVFGVLSASAAPTGEQVVAGDVTFNRDGSVTVIHASDGAIIHYDSFDIFANEGVQFIQPGESARVLNRVFGDATRIEGSLLANGIVYIVNPAGIYLDGHAVVQVGGLVAAAGHISDEDFLAGVDRFDLTGPVVNASGSLRGGDVALLGSTVENHGAISAPDGTIALVAGDRVVLLRLGGRVAVQVDGPPDPRSGTGVLQAGQVDAGSGQAILAVGDHYSLAINHQGVTRGSDVELSGGADGVVQVQGELDARGDAQGGSIHVLGDRIALLSATLDASGQTGGGEIRVGGDLHGGGALPAARRTFVDAGSTLRADAIASGDGGSVVVWGDEANVMSGSITARGGARGGDGGFAEISSLGALQAPGDVDLGAPAGANGTLLFDPQDIVIVGGTGDGSDTPDTASDQLLMGTVGQVLFGDVGTADPFQIYESEIEGTNANLVLEASNSITTSGTFDHDAAGEGSGVVVIQDGNDLTLRTRNDVNDEVGSAMAPGIDLGALEWRTSGGGTITIATGSDGMGGGGTGAAAGVSAGNLVSRGGGVNVSTMNGSISLGDVDTSGGGGVNVSTMNGSISLGDVDTSGLDGDAGQNGGSVTVSAQSGDVTTGAIRSSGGAGAVSNGGGAGRVDVETGDGSVAVASVTANGGDGATRGGNAALPAFLFASPPTILLRAGDTDGSGGSSVTVGGALTSVGGTGADGSGGLGGPIQVATVATPMDPNAPPAPETGGGPIAIGGDVDSSGGAGTSAGGAAGSVTLGAAVDGDLTLGGRVIAVDGAGSDARANTRVSLTAGGAIDFTSAGPQIRTTENVSLTAATVGVSGPVEVDAMGLPIDPTMSQRTLDVSASQSANVDVTTAGFNVIRITATSALAGIDVTQAVGDASKPDGTPIAIHIAGASGTSTIVSADTRDRSIPGGVLLAVTLQDELQGMNDQHLSLAVAGSAIQAGGTVLLTSEDDVTLADGAVSIRPPDESQPAARAGSLVVTADSDGDGDGAIQDSGAGVAIDMNVDGVNSAGDLILSSGSGVGEGMPIQTANVGRVGARVTGDSGGIHLVNTAGGAVTMFPPGGTDALLVDNDTGNIDVENQSGDLIVDGDVRAGSPAAGGSVTLRATDPNAAIRFQARTARSSFDMAGGLVEAGGNVTLDAPATVLVRDLDVHAGGNVIFTGAIDSDVGSRVTRNLAIQAGGAMPTVSFGGDVGSNLALRNLRVDGQTELAQDTSFALLQSASFRGDVVAGGVAMDVTAGGDVHFGGDVGQAGGQLSGLSVDASRIVFDADGPQTVNTGDGGIALGPSGLAEPPTVASIGKSGGDLVLETSGDLLVGPNHKLTVDGVASLTGATVTVGDVNAQELQVSSPDFRIRARAGGQFLVPGVGLVPDDGTELLANVIDLSNAPTVVEDSAGARAPILATRSGSVDNAGALMVVALARPITSSDLVSADGQTFFDLGGIGTSDPGNETEPEPRPVPELLPARPGDTASAGSATAPGPDAVQAFLRCAQAGGRRGSVRSCAPAPGSPLDSARGEEIARLYAQLLGGSPEARAARRLLADETAGAARDPALRELATLLAQIRLLGMDLAGYQRVRDQWLDAARGSTPRDTLLADVRAHGRGIPL